MWPSFFMRRNLLRFPPRSFPAFAVAAVAIASVLALGAALYWPGLGGPFLLDDFTNTQLIRLERLDWPHLLGVATSNESGLYGRVIPVLTFAFNYYFSGFSEQPYKYTNLMIHLLVGLSLFWFGGRLLGAHLRDAHRSRAWLLSGIAATLWLVHPLQVSTVLYVVQRMAQLSTLFTILALLSFVIGRERIAAGRPRGGIIMSAGTTLFGGLAVLSKENAILIPLFIALIELLFFRFRTLAPRPARVLHVYLGAFVALPVLAGVAYFSFHAHSFLIYDYREFTLSERLMTEAHILLFYLRLIFLPRLAAMSLYHDDFPVTTSFDLGTALAIGILLGLISLVYFLRARATVLAFSIAWFFIAHSLESTFLPLELVFEHRNYLALYGPCLALTYYAVHFDKRLRSSLTIRASALAILLGIFCLLTYMRVDTWSDRTKLAMTMYATHPNSGRATLEVIQLHLDRREFSDALELIGKLVQLRPWDPGIPVMAISIQCFNKTLDRSYLERAQQEIAAARLPGFLVPTLQALETDYIKGRCPVLKADELMTLLDALLDNTRLAGLSGIHNVYMLRARLFAHMQRNTDALSSYDGAYRSRPKALYPLIEKAYLQLNIGALDDAAATVAFLRKTDSRMMHIYSYKIDELEQFLAMAQLDDVCKKGSVDRALVAQAARRLTQTAAPNQFAPYIVALQSAYLDGKCPALHLADALELTAAFAAHAAPDSAEPPYALALNHARLLARANRPAEAVAAYDRAIALAPGIFAAYFEKAYLELNLGNLSNAETAYAYLYEHRATRYAKHAREIDELGKYLARAQHETRGPRH